MFEDINDVVNEQPLIPAATLPVPTLTAEQLELEQLRGEVAELKQKQLESERDERIKSAAAATKMKDFGPTSGEMSVRRQRAIAQAGNVARWYKYSVSDRVNILTDGGYVPVKDAELAKYFGPKASSSETTRLMATDNKRYRSYRATAVELGWIG